MFRAALRRHRVSYPQIPREPQHLRGTRPVAEKASAMSVPGLAPHRYLRAPRKIARAPRFEPLQGRTDRSAAPGRDRAGTALHPKAQSPPPACLFLVAREVRLDGAA